MLVISMKNSRQKNQSWRHQKKVDRFHAKNRYVCEHRFYLDSTFDDSLPLYSGCIR